jgi:cell division septum initiation protein DivIVA
MNTIPTTILSLNMSEVEAHLAKTYGISSDDLGDIRRRVHQLNTDIGNLLKERTEVTAQVSREASNNESFAQIIALCHFVESARHHWRKEVDLLAETVKTASSPLVPKADA